MAAFTPNSGGIVKWDSLSGGSVNATLDTYTISNGTTLLIETDSYQCAGHSAAFGSLDTVSFTGTGGTLKIDGTNVRVIPFNTGSGTVPAIGTTISQGGVSSYLLGVWPDWQSEPLAAAAAMPTTGFIKVKDKTGGSFSAGALTGISASATGADVVGWIEVRGADTATITVPRIGTFETVGDWFELGTTNGSRGQVLPCPTTATVAGVFPGIWVETASGSGVFERFTGVGSMANLSTNPTDERGKMFWQTTSGIRIGSDGTNNVGYLPPSGCRVRIPNVILTCCTRTAGSGSGPRVLPNATLATRQEFITTSAGSINIAGAVVQWYCNFVNPYAVTIANSAISSKAIVSNLFSPIDIDNVIISPVQSQLDYAFDCLASVGGGTVKDSMFTRFGLESSGYVARMSFCRNITNLRVKAQSLLNRASASTGTWYCEADTDCMWDDCTSIGSRHVYYSNTRTTVRNLKYADNFSGATTSSSGTIAVSFSAGSVDCIMDGYENLDGITNVHPYNALLYCQGTTGTKIRNIGTYASPVDFGSANACGYVVNSGGSNIGMKVQRCYVVNTRSGPWSILNTDSESIVESVFSDYADTTPMLSLDAIVKGVGLTGTAGGQAAVYGTHWVDRFKSATTGAIEVLCNEPTAASAPQCAVSGGTPFFNSVGQVALRAVGDEVTWEMPYFVKGHTSAANLAPTLTGTNAGNLAYEFQYDLGSGYNGTWLTLNQTNWFAVGSITPSVGIRLKVRARCTTADIGNLLTNIAMPTVTDSTSQNVTYPLDTNTITFTGIPTGTDVVVLTAGTSTILAQQDSIPGTTYAFTYSGAQSVDVGFIKPGYVPLYLRGLALGTSDSSIPVQLTPDRNYAA